MDAYRLLIVESFLIVQPPASILSPRGEGIFETEAADQLRNSTPFHKGVWD